MLEADHFLLYQEVYYSKKIRTFAGKIDSRRNIMPKCRFCQECGAKFIIAMPDPKII
jgi:hypothetical protein